MDFPHFRFRMAAGRGVPVEFVVIVVPIAEFVLMDRRGGRFRGGRERRDVGRFVGIARGGIVRVIGRFMGVIRRRPMPMIRTRRRAARAAAGARRGRGPAGARRGRSRGRGLVSARRTRGAGRGLACARRTRSPGRGLHGILGALARRGGAGAASASRRFPRRCGRSASGVARCKDHCQKRRGE